MEQRIDPLEENGTHLERPSSSSVTQDGHALLLHQSNALEALPQVEVLRAELSDLLRQNRKRLARVKGSAFVVYVLAGLGRLFACRSYF